MPRSDDEGSSIRVPNHRRGSARACRRSPATTGRCNDPNGACIGSDCGCRRLMSWQSGRRPDQAVDVVLGGMGPRQRPGGAFERLHRQDRHSNEIRVRPVDELCRSLPQRAQLEGKALRSHHRGQPVDRRRRRERPLRQAQRFLRQRKNLDGRLHAGDGGRLFAMAEEHGELLGAAGDGRRDRLDLSQGLVRTAGNPVRIQEEIRARPRPAANLGRTQADRRVLSGPGDRRQEGLRSLHLHRARLRRHHHGRDQRALRLGLSIRRSEKALSDGRLRQLARRGSRDWNSTSRSTSAAPRRA